MNYKLIDGKLPQQLLKKEIAEEVRKIVEAGGKTTTSSQLYLLDTMVGR